MTEDLFHELPIGGYRADRQGRLVVANKALLRILNCFSIDGLNQLLAADGCRLSCQRQEVLKQLEDQDELQGIESRWLSPDEKIIWVRENVRVFRDDHQQVAFYQGTVEECAPPDRNAGGVEGSDLLNALMESIPDTIYFKDRLSRFIAVNNAQAKMLGLNSPAEATGKSDFDFFDPAHAQDAFADEQRMITSRQPVLDKIERIRRADGEFRWVSATKVPMTNRNNEVIGIAGISRDITDRKNAELERQALFRIMQVISANEDPAEQLPSIHEAIGEVVDARNFAVALRNELTNQLRFEFFVDEHEASFAYSPGDGLASLLLRRNSPLLLSEKQQLQVIEEANLNAGGRTAEAWLGIPLRASGATIGALILKSYEDPNAFKTRDVEFLTSVASQIAMALERQRAQAQLQRTAAMLAKSNRELQDFASVASHDLQEPLRKIQAFGDRLRTKCEAQLGPTGQDYLGRMLNASSRMQTLIDDLLTFSRVTTKAQPFTRVDLNLVAHEVLSDLEVRIEQAGAVVEVSSLPSIDADPLQMRQLLQNLIANALKFRKPGEAPLVRIWAEPDLKVVEGSSWSLTESEAWQIFVSDNGIGFDEKYLDRIFTVFQRLHGRNTYEGTGVGLAVCRRIVERHDGSITASSAPDQGSTFTVKLPARQLKGANS